MTTDQQGGIDFGTVGQIKGEAWLSLHFLSFTVAAVGFRGGLYNKPISVQTKTRSIYSYVTCLRVHYTQLFRQCAAFDKGRDARRGFFELWWWRLINCNCKIWIIQGLSTRGVSLCLLHLRTILPSSCRRPPRIPQCRFHSDMSSVRYQTLMVVAKPEV